MDTYKIVLLLFVCFYNAISSPVPESFNATDSARIVNGYEVSITEVPYQASLRKRVVSGWAHTCGAIIITYRCLLTAAHCVTSYTSSPSLLQVSVGSASRLSGGKTYDISSVVVHEQYSTSTLENDIALLVTSKSIDFSQSVQVVRVANQYFTLPAGTEALVSGFGTTSYEGSSSSTLLAAKVNIVSQEECARSYLRIASITKGMICAYAANPARDACQGDSGGPLVAKYQLVGIVSWGEGCADTRYPGVYTRVAEYHDWIWQKVANVKYKDESE